MTRAAPQGERVFGWLWLAVSTTIILLVPLWLVLSGIYAQMHPLSDVGASTIVSWAGLGGLMYLLFVLSVAMPTIGVVSLVLFLVRRWREKAEKQKYRDLAGDGGVMRPDSWSDQTKR